MNTKNKRICAIIVGAVALLCGACHSIESWENDALGNFDALWTILDEHYCFFEEKGIDWEETGRRYRAQVSKEMDQKELFEVCAAMLDELKDGHINLISWFNVSYYRKWWSDYPQNFDWRLIQEYYLDFDYSSGNGMSYKILADGQVGYVYFSSFAYSINHSFVNEMLLSMKDLTSATTAGATSQVQMPCYHTSSMKSTSADISRIRQAPGILIFQNLIPTM